MKRSGTVLAASVLAASLGIASLASVAWGQSPSSAPAFMELQHRGVYPGAARAAPAMSLKDVPLSYAEISGRAPRTTFAAPDGTVAHMMPTVKGTAARRAAGLSNPSGPLVYHSGGQVMQPYVEVFNIYWNPSLLQSGATTGYSAKYTLTTGVTSSWLAGHGILNIATQYYQTIGGTTTYINNAGGLGGFFVDTSPYPASGCSDLDVSPSSNCITDAQMQAEITSVMNAHGLTGGLNKIFVLFTSSGEGSCFDSTNQSCAYTDYCAYHSTFSLNGQSVIYAIIPYGSPSFCQAAGQTTPNDPFGDLAANVLTHEIIEAATDPLLNAWFGTGGLSDEIGDICNFDFGTNTWGSGSGAGNQMWNGFILEVQQQYDNHAGACVQVGPQ